MKEKSISTQCFRCLIVLFTMISWSVAAHAEVVDRVVAIVNDDCIALSELNERIEPFIRELREADYPEEAKRQMLFKLRQELLDKMIDEKLAHQESEKLQVQVDDRDVDQQIERIKSENFLTDEELRKSLAAQGLTVEQYHSRLKEQMLQVKLINIEVKSKIAITDEDIRSYYEAHKADYEGTQKYRLRTILIKRPSSASPEEKEAASSVMVSILNALRSGAAFDELAREYSQDATAPAGGDLGLFTLDELSPELRETVASMSEGQVSPVIQTPQGYRILMLQEIRREPGKSLKEASIEIHDKLYQKFVDEKYKDWLKALRDRSYVKIVL
jgi:peptidyl-prolyl cis-trans isomerase SurA